MRQSTGKMVKIKLEFYYCLIYMVKITTKVLMLNFFVAVYEGFNAVKVQRVR